MRKTCSTRLFVGANLCSPASSTESCYDQEEMRYDREDWAQARCRPLSCALCCSPPRPPWLPGTHTQDKESQYFENLYLTSLHGLWLWATGTLFRWRQKLGGLRFLLIRKLKRNWYKMVVRGKELNCGRKERHFYNFLESLSKIIFSSIIHRQKIVQIISV